MKDRMDIAERFKYLRLMKERYEMADRKTKGELLDEMAVVTGLNRKHLIVRMGSPGPYQQKRCRQRGREYGEDVEAAIVVIGDTMDWICAERLQPNLVEIASHLAKFDELILTTEVSEKLARMSLSTLRRSMQRVRPEGDLLPQVRRGRRRDSAIQAQVPVAIIPYDVPEPGHFEVDLVYHTRAGATGDLLCTLQFIDVLTGWSERFAVQGHTFEVIWRAVDAFRKTCPIPVREMHIDNGSEFLNPAFISHFGTDFQNASLTRSRPGHKNDNRFVEQKNSSLVRAYLGNLYLHTSQHLALLKPIYEDMRLYYNLYQPVLRQTERAAVVLPNGVCSIRRKQDQASTPLQRLLRARPPISRARAEHLRQSYDTTNPRELKRRIHARLRNLYRLADAERRAASSLRLDYHLQEP